MQEWDKVFTTGVHTDSSGNKKEWTTADLDRIVNSFNPSFHEPPVVIGHPSDNAPAFGWVEAIKRVGNDLYLKYKDVAPEFKEWTKKGFFKKKSIAVYPDGSLRHIGYLGAMPPAIKGLPDFQFKDGDHKGAAVTYEFGDWADQVNASMWRRMRGFFIAQFGLDAADSVIPDYNVASLEQDAAQPDDQCCSPLNQYEEEDMKPEEVQKIVTDAVSAATQQFSEQMKNTTEVLAGIKTQLESVSKELDTAKTEGLRREFAEFLGTTEMQKRIPESQREATINHLMTLVAAKPVEFGEGDNKTSKPALDVYKEQLAALPEVVAFGEHATRDKAVETTVNGLSAEELSRKAVEFQEAEAKAGRTISMTDAVNHVKKGGK